MLEEAGVYESEEENMTEEQVDIREKAKRIRKEKSVIRHNHRLNKHRYLLSIYDLSSFLYSKGFDFSLSPYY